MEQGLSDDSGRPLFFVRAAGVSLPFLPPGDRTALFLPPGQPGSPCLFAARRPDLLSPPFPESRGLRPAGQPPDRTAKTGRSALRVFQSQFSASKRVIIRFFRIFALRKPGLEDFGRICPGTPDSITVRHSLRTAPKPHIQKL